MKNAEWMIQNGMKFSKLSSWYNLGGRNIVCYDSKNLYEEESSVVQKNIITKWLDMEHEEQILDDAEKRYLKGVIRPFRNDVEKICKTAGGKDCEWIAFYGKSYFFLPYFDAGTMYKGMKLGHKYSLEELGL